LHLNVYFLSISVGRKNSDKVPMPRVVSMAEKPIIVRRRPHAWIVRPRQWHVARGGPVVEKKFRRGGYPWHD